MNIVNLVSEHTLDHLTTHSFTLTHIPHENLKKKERKNAVLPKNKIDVKLSASIAK